MAGKGIRREKHTLVHPRDMKPQDWLTFVEMEGFCEEWHNELCLTDDQLSLFQAAIMAAPTANPVMPDTGGFRVLSLTRVTSGEKDSNGKDDESLMTVHLGYVYFEDYHVVLLVVARIDGTFKMFSLEERKAIRELIERETIAFAKGKTR